MLPLCSLQALAQQRMAAAAFDTSRLADFTERVQINVPATQLTPLVRESGRLVVTNARLYFQPLHNVTGDSPVRIHSLADVAAVARRRSSLKPTGAQTGGDGRRRTSLMPDFLCAVVLLKMDSVFGCQGM